MPGFVTLWANHPTIRGDVPLLDRATYPNQCAINVGAAIIRSGNDMRTFKGTWSWQKDKPRYPIRAQELADWLNSPGAQMPARVERLPGNGFEEKMADRTGIVFFQNYWGPGQQGDHIDLWNGARLTDWTSWVRIQGRISIPGLWSDYAKAASVWFWKMA